MNQNQPDTGASIHEGGAVLVAVAARIELDAIASGLGISPPTDELPAWGVFPLAPGLDAVLTGVGKANAAGGVARALDPSRHTGVVNLGICGSLPGGPALGTLVLGEASVFADEGLATPEGFRSCRAMGFPLVAGESDEITPDPAWVNAWRDRVDLLATIATVSTCSGTDERAREIASRTGARVEAMEGAAAGLAARAIVPGIRFAELRVVSNTAGDRPGQRWDLARALTELGRVLGRVGLCSSPDRA